jgi:TfoX/Sxy family transcriptional regulator of competence genes
MALYQTLADRVRELIAETGEERVEEKRMFGGICFLVDDKICVAAKLDRLLVRLHPDLYESSLEKDGVVPMARDGKGMIGYVFVSADVLNHRKYLQYWVNLALEFNPLAKRSKR